MMQVDYSLFSKEEIKQKMCALKLDKGRKPGEGDVLTLLQIAKYLHFSNYTTSQASYGIMSDKTQIILSRFFRMWEEGRIRFTYSQRGGWRIDYPENPVPRQQSRVGLHVTLGESGPRLGYRRED